MNYESLKKRKIKWIKQNFARKRGICDSNTFCVSYFAKPKITNLANYISKSTAERAEYNKLNDECKSYDEFSKAEERFLNYEEILLI